MPQVQHVLLDHYLLLVGFEPFVFFEYDTKNNVNKSTYHLIEPETKEEFVQIRERIFDTFKRPSMGLDYLLGVDPLPWRYYMDVWELTLSQNNIVADLHSGNTFTYEYNNDGYPVSVTVKWKDIETEKPLTMKKVYQLLLFALFIVPATFVYAQDEDAEGCKDYPMFNRMTDFKINSCELKDFEGYKFKISNSINDEEHTETVEGKYFYQT